MVLDTFPLMAEQDLRDPSRNNSDASYGFDYSEVDRRLAPKEEISLEDLETEFLVRGILIVKEDARPHLCIDAVIYGLRHPVYGCFSMGQIATWNKVTKPSVHVRVKEVQTRLGLTDAAVDSLSRVRSGPLWNASHGLVTALLFVAKYSEPKSVIDCIVRATGHPMSEGVSLDTIGKRYGVTKAGIHKQEKDVVQNLNLPRWRHNKKPESSQHYAQSNTHTAVPSCQPNGPGLV